MKRNIIISAILLSIFIITSLTSAPSLSPDKKEKHPGEKKESFYEDQWEKADLLLKKGLPKSALVVVDEIYASSKETNNSINYIKAVLYKGRIRADYEENHSVKTLVDLENELKTAQFPIKEILHSLTAEMYWKYYMRNRYKIMQRSAIKGDKNDDILTWDASKFEEKTIQHYMLSLASKEKLSTASLKEYDVLLLKKKNSKKYRPSLYDLLAHRAIDFFIKNNFLMVKAYRPHGIKPKDLFASHTEFIKMETTANNTFHPALQIQAIFKDLLRIHINNKNPYALLDADLKRLKYALTISTEENKNQLCLNTLKSLENDFSDSEASSDISYEIAMLYKGMGNKYSAKDSSSFAYKWHRKKALESCEAVQKKFPKTDAAKKCELLAIDLKKPSLNITMDYTLTPEEQSKALAGYSNLNKLYFRIIKADYYADSKFRRHNRGRILFDHYKAMPKTTTWMQKLPDDGDMQSHATEIIIPATDKGYYILLASDNEEFEYNDKIISCNKFWSTGISFYNRRNGKSQLEFYVADRKEGSPLKKVSVNTYLTNQRHKDIREYKGPVYSTNKEGYFMIPPMPENNRSESFVIEFSLKGDTLITDNSFYRYFHQNNFREIENTYFFTDRAIYRPGQQIYFKGIVIHKSKEKKEIVPNKKMEVELFNTHGQKISTLKLQTNEYGSFNGSFTIPSGSLTGQMYIRSANGRISFSVEEYKRPTFEVVFDKVDDIYKIGEEVLSVGHAKSYSSAAITDAKVSWKIYRQAYNPWWRWYPSYSSQGKKEISSGNTTTDDKGEFKIRFIAEAGNKKNRTGNLMYYYTITTDVTDISGETQSKQKTIVCGHKALLVNVDIPEEVNMKTAKSFNIISTNLNGDPTDSKGTIEISRLQSPQKALRERSWAIPDVFVLTKAEHSSLFPNDIYNNENNFMLWPKEKAYYNKTYDTQKGSILTLSDLQEWPQGKYKLEIKSEDKYGTEVINKSYFTLFDETASELPYKSNFRTVALTTNAKVGDTAVFLVGSSLKDVDLLYEIEYNNRFVGKKRLKISNKQIRIEIPVIEQHKGGFYLHLIFVKNNRIYSKKHEVNVPRLEKKLDITLESFRSTIIPGTKEEWRLRIKGSKGEAVASELMLAMYDKSLDKFKKNNWALHLYHDYKSSIRWETYSAFATRYGQAFSYNSSKPRFDYKFKGYDELNKFGLGGFRHRYSKSMSHSGMRDELMDRAPSKGAPMELVSKAGATIVDGIKTAPSEQASAPKKEEDFSAIQLRKNFEETAFFYPELHTDKNGDVLLSFTAPDALTQWNFMGLAHTKDLRYGMFNESVVTKKNLMITPNLPRFLREGDQIRFSAKISNLSDGAIEGKARLEFFNAINMQPVQLVSEEKQEVSFSAKKDNNTLVFWDITIPEGIGALQYKIVASAGSHSDGEERIIPVLSNRILLTESMPMNIKGNEERSFQFEKLKKSAQSPSIRNHKLTFEFTQNPAWHAVLALPSIIEGSDESVMQSFNRMYANSLASYIINSNKKIEQVFKTWQTINPDVFLSNLDKNKELKNIILEETPWLNAAKDEKEQKQRIANLFRKERIQADSRRAIEKLIALQHPDGAWPWFAGMRSNRFITQQIISGLGRLDNLGVQKIKSNHQLMGMVQKAIRYCDNQLLKDYQNICDKHEKTKKGKHISNLQINYLYARSFFSEIKVNKESEEAYNYFAAQTGTYFTSFGKYSQGMAAIFLHRIGKNDKATDIMKSLKETSLSSKEQGMYWREFTSGYNWYQLPIASQALMIEAFSEITNDKEAVEEMKIWLLKQKQVQNWRTSKATTEACYALLLRGTDLLNTNASLSINIGNDEIFNSTKPSINTEAGSGYFKKSWEAKEISANKGDVKIKKEGEGISWGAMYWQYFEDIDKVTPHKTPLQLSKKLFVERGSSIEPIIGAMLKTGDRIKVRIELRVDRAMEYVHMKDMRAAAFEPVEVLSRYRYQDGLGYYQSTRDAATHFYFSHLSKGTYVFEYTLIASQEGDFSNGITTIESMYAPEFRSHSEGVRVGVVN